VQCGRKVDNLELAARGGRIQTGLSLFVPCGLRAMRSLLVLAQLVEPPTQGFSVDSVTDSLTKSMS
ncbi:MAG: hypothetical protein ACKVIB_10630, partial [Pseudomonadales bacterium]|jgi:hypothetical protein